MTTQEVGKSLGIDFSNQKTPDQGKMWVPELPKRGEVRAVIIDADVFPPADPGILETLDLLAIGTRWNVAILSFGDEPSDQVADRLGLGETSVPVIGADVAPPSLPGNLFRQAATMLGHQPDQALYFGRGLGLIGASTEGMGVNPVSGPEQMVQRLTEMQQWGVY